MLRERICHSAREQQGSGSGCPQADETPGVKSLQTTVRRLSRCGAQELEALYPERSGAPGGGIKLPSLTPADVVTKTLYGLTGMARA